MCCKFIMYEKYVRTFQHTVMKILQDFLVEIVNDVFIFRGLTIKICDFKRPLFMMTAIEC